MTPPGGPIVDLSLLELFRNELETHAHALETGLVDVEQRQSRETLEPLMRAAHSIKGAARIVGLDGAVGLAHAMEDILEGARAGRLVLNGNHVDALLQANDLYLRLASTKPEEIAAAIAAGQDGMNRMQATLRGLLLAPAEKAAAPASAAPSPSPAPVVSADQPVPVAAPGGHAGPPSQVGAPQPPSPEPAPSQPRERLDQEFVRVQAVKLDRLLGLAGECLVQANSAKGLVPPLLSLKNGQHAMSILLEKVDQMLEDQAVTGPLRAMIVEALDHAGRNGEELERHMAGIDVLSRRMESLSDRLCREVSSVRMRPFSECTPGFPRMIRDLAKGLGKKVDFRIVGGETPVDSNILVKLEAPLTHLLRNAVDHGLEDPAARVQAGKPAEGSLTLEAQHRSGMLEITITDDGRGIDPDTIRRVVIEKGYLPADVANHLAPAEVLEFLFLPGFSLKNEVTEISGRGVGLDVVLSMVQDVGGSRTVESVPGRGTTFHLQLPISRSVLRTLLVEIAGQQYGFNLDRIDRLLEVSQEDIILVEDRPTIIDKGDQVGMVMAAQVLGQEIRPSPDGRARVVVISDRLDRYGVVVDRFLGERDLVIVSLDPRLGKIPNIAAGAILDDGFPVLLFDVGDLVRSIANLLSSQRLKKFGFAEGTGSRAKKTILVVDDSLTVREVQRRLLEHHGYEVTLAVDGMDGWNLLRERTYSLVISDIDMPRMNGIELVGRIKSNPQTRDIPVMIVSYKDREEDRMAGMRAGANYYLTKSSFHDETLLRVVNDLIGEP